MIIKTKFRFWAFLLLGCFIALSFILPLFFTIWVTDMKSEAPAVALFGIGLLIFTWLWLLLGELRTKAVAVQFEAEFLTLKRFMGLIPAGIYNFHQFEGYTTCLLPSKTGYYKYLYLIMNGRKLIKVSQFYHGNYSEVKKLVAKKIKFIGKERFSYRKEFKEIFEF